MKIALEQEDIEAIARRVFEMVEPLLKDKGEGVHKDHILDVGGLAKYLSVDSNWIYKQVSLREIPHFKVGKYLRFKRSEVDKWIAKSTIMPVPPLKIANKCR